MMILKHRQKVGSLFTYYGFWNNNLNNHKKHITVLNANINHKSVTKQVFMSNYYTTENSNILRNINTDLSKINIELEHSDDISISKAILVRGKAATEYQESLLTEFISNNDETNFEDWDKLTENILKLDHGILNKQNIDGRIMEVCANNNKLNVARNYLEYLKYSKKKFNTATVCAFLKVCYSCQESCTDQDLARVKQFTNYLLQRYEVIDHVLGDAILKGLALTNQCDKCFEVADKIQQISQLTITSHNTIISCLLKNNLIQRAWDYMVKMTENKLMPLQYVMIQWFDIYKNNSDELEKLLLFLERCDYKPKKLLCDHIVYIFSELPTNKKLIGIYATISNRGKCQHCGETLTRLDVSPEEFITLQDAFLNRVLVGKDVFYNTTPAELQKFFSTVKKKGPFDVILDGLNIAFMCGVNQQPASYVKLLEHTVKHFTEHNQKILLLGRKHMKKWPNISALEEFATSFYIDDVSEDDPFMLYAALSSGPDTVFVTRDLLRSEKFTLENDSLMLLFKRWQQSHQIFITFIAPSGRLYMKMPITFQMTVQKTKGGGWHIPYQSDDYTGEEQFGIHRKWLCLRPKQ